MPVIRVDEEVMNELRLRAISLKLVFESPNATLRVILGLDSATDPHPAEERKGRKMLSYVRRAKDRYDNKLTDREGFVTEVWNGILASAANGGRNQRVVEKSSKAFLALSEENGRSPVSPRAISLRAGIDQTASLLWPWLDWNAGVIRLEKNNSGGRHYTISGDDFDLLRKVILRPGDKG
jgi:hypothetical protein